MKTVAGLDLCFAVIPFLSRGHVIENSHLNFDKSQYLSQLHTYYYNNVGHKYGLARCQRIHFCVIPLAKKFVLSMIVCIFAASVLAKPLNNAQIVRGVFCLYTFEYGESYPLYKTV
jgi:hypothetical protein